MLRSSGLRVAGKRWLAILAVPFLLAGCEGGANKGVRVTGKVLFEGKPVDQGTITFTYVGDNARATSGLIHEGQYSVDGVSPGTNVVLVISSPHVEATEENKRRLMHGVSYFDMAPYFHLGPKRMQQIAFDMLGLQGQYIGEGDVGNNKPHEIGEEDQELDLQLKSKW